MFASVNPIAPVIFACMNVSDIPQELIEHTTWSVTNVDGRDKIVEKIPATFKDYLKSKKGYVYIMKGSDFPIRTSEGSWQVKSKNPVKPIDKVEVQFEDFEKIGGEILWK